MAQVPSIPPAPSGGAGGWRIEGPTPITLVGGQWFDLVCRDAERVYLVVFGNAALGDTVVSPGGTAVGYGWHVPTDTYALLLHTASYPGLVGGEFYIRSANAGDVYVMTAHPIH